METDYDVVILGGGAAGLSAALYAGRAMLKTLVLESLGCGGQVLVTDMVENYPGFPEGIRGPELSQFMCDQSQKFGAQIKYEEITGVENLDSASKVVHTDDGSYTTRAMIIATGGSHNKLGIPGEEEYAGKGVSYCAVCDGNFFRGSDVVVVGGGDAAIDEGLYLAGIVNQVTVVHRRDQLRASRILQERAFSNPKFKFYWSYAAEEILGNGVVSAVRVKDIKSGEVSDYSTDAVFIYIGFHPNSDVVRDKVALDSTGHIYTDINMATSLPGVYAAGDVRVNSFRQLGSAVGDGITASMAAYHYITEG